MASLLIGQEQLVLLVGGEPDGHLGDDTAQHGSETLVQTESGLLLDNVDAGGHEAAGLHSGGLGPSGQLHAHLDGIERVTDEGLHHTSTTTSDQVDRGGGGLLAIAVCLFRHGDGSMRKWAERLRGSVRGGSIGGREKKEGRGERRVKKKRKSNRDTIPRSVRQRSPGIKKKKRRYRRSQGELCARGDTEV